MEKYQWQKLKAPVVGVDEVGRGCLAGRVYAAAVILPQDINDSNVDYLQYTDSKLLSEKRRQQLSKEIRANFEYGIAFADVEEIAALNILHASLLAMKRAVEKLSSSPGHVLVDGKFTIPGLTCLQSPVVKGDLRASPIAAAAIIAKVERDKYISEYSEKYPEYGFEKHKAYATKKHKEAIAKWGPISIHRKDFAGVREHWQRLRQ